MSANRKLINRVGPIYGLLPVLAFLLWRAAFGADWMPSHTTGLIIFGAMLAYIAGGAAMALSATLGQVRDDRAAIENKAN